MSNNFKADANMVLLSLAQYIDDCQLKTLPVIKQPPMSELIHALDLENLIDGGGLHGKRLESFIKNYLDATTKLHHKNFLAHQISVPHPTGALASFIDGTTNNETSVYEMGPAASAIEYFMINWMLKKIGWTASPVPGEKTGEGLADYSGGVFTHGGSLANLTAMITARSAKFPDIWKDGQPSNMVILVPEQSHYSLKRTSGILGLGEKNCIPMPSDKDGRVIAEEIPILIKKLHAKNKEVMAIVGNACGTAAGLYDPLDKIGNICNEHDVWFHVDAAHGAGAIICEDYRYLVKGIEKADSIIWDAHKMFRTPALCAAILVKDYRYLDTAFTQEASYLFHDKDQNGVDFARRTVECTKSSLGLKMFMTIAAMGEENLKDYIGSRTELARDAARYIDEQNDFECPVMPETNILCFRIGDNDEKQLEIRKRLLEQGNFYITSTKYKDVRWLRCVFINPDTRIGDFKSLIEEIRKISKVL